MNWWWLVVPAAFFLGYCCGMLRMFFKVLQKSDEEI